jgi:4-hydroxy-3-polyprenylbenzoate decarboxylase
MGYSTLEDSLNDLEKHGHLVRVKEELDPRLELAAIHLRVHEAGGPALLFEKLKGCEFRAASNIFGTLDRSRFLFRDSLRQVENLIALKTDPTNALKQPLRYIGTPFAAWKALPKKIRTGNTNRFQSTTISSLPQVQSWPKDGGPFVTLPIVYSEDIERPGAMQSNLGMYRIQLGGNAYIQDEEIGLHYQLHRGIGVHQTKANSKGEPLKVSVFVGGPPSHSFSAVMPLPEGISELTFAGVLGNRRFRYFYHEGFCISADADFVITGEVFPGDNKPEGPFGDHLGYYSLTHDFPVMRVRHVLHKPGAIWPFTVVGRPPQEDTSFGGLIHEITGAAIPAEIPGLQEVHAVDAAGVHPLLLAIGSERYTPYQKIVRPQEILTIASHILGTGQLSLAKFLFIAANNDNPALRTHDEEGFFRHILERADWQRDLHFHTNTTIDTLDYSGESINAGSKIVVAAAGPPVRQIAYSLDTHPIALPEICTELKVVMPGVLAIACGRFNNYGELPELIQHFDAAIPAEAQQHWPLIVLCDDAAFTSATLRNWLWVTFTRCNPSHDIHGVQSFVEHKHWGCRGPLIIDARIKPHHAPVLEKDPAVEQRIDRLFAKGGSLHGVVK